MDLSDPSKAIGSKSAISVLVVLSRSSAPLSGRDIARRSKVSQTSVANALRNLTSSGLVYQTAGGYSLNDDHVLAPAVKAIAAARRSLFSRIQGLVEAWSTKPIGVVVFGSTARGDGSDQSDIDILVIRPPGIAAEDTLWDEQLSELSEMVTLWTGNPAEILDYDTDEVERAMAEGRPMWSNIAAEGLLLVGISPKELAYRQKAS